MNNKRKKDVLNNKKEIKKYNRFLYFLLIVLIIFLVTNIRTKRLESMTFDIKVVSTSNNNIWSDDTKIEIFNSNRNDSNNTKIIYPGVQGEYYFKIYNDMPIDIDYNITGYEEGDILPKMEYQLYKVDEVDNNIEWKSISEIKVDNNILSKNDCEYVLRWRWNEDDSFINDGGNYTLHLVISYGEK